MAFLCPMRFNKKKGRSQHAFTYIPGRLTGSSSVDTLLGIELGRSVVEDSKEHAHMKMVVLQDFQPCVEDELEVKRGDIVTFLYRDNDWVYVQAGHGGEGFVPYTYCAAQSNPERQRKKPERKSTIGRSFSYLKSIDRELQNRRFQPSITVTPWNNSKLNNSGVQQQQRSGTNVVNNQLPQIEEDNGEESTVFRPQSPRQRLNSALNRSANNNNGRIQQQLQQQRQQTQSPYHHLMNGDRPDGKTDLNNIKQLSNTSLSTTIHTSTAKYVNGVNLQKPSFAYNVTTTGSGSSGNSKTSCNTFQEYGESSDSQSMFGNISHHSQNGYHHNHLSDDGIVDDFQNGDQHHHHHNNNQSNPPSEGFCLVIKDFLPEADCDVEIRRGEWIQVLSIDTDNWAWINKKNEVEGFVPITHLAINKETLLAMTNEDSLSVKTDMENESIFSTDSHVIKQRGTRLVVLFDYHARTIDDLDVRRGEFVYADLDQQDEENWIWAYAPASNKQGFIPRSYARPPATSIPRSTSGTSI